MTCYQGMSYPLPWARKVQRVENWQMPVVWMPSQLQRSSFLIGERGFTWHLHSVQIPHLAVFGDLKPHQTLPWFKLFQVIPARQAPLARLHLGISWPSRLYGWRQTWTSACTGQLDLKLTATFLSFHIISCHFIPGVHSSKEAVQEKSFFHPTQNVFSFRNYIWNGRYSYNRLPLVEQQSPGRTTLLGWSSNALVQSLSTFRAAAMA